MNPMPKGIYNGNKGKIPWNKGLKVGTSWHQGKKNVYSIETLEKMSIAKKGKVAWNKGKRTGKQPIEVIEKRRKSLTGLKRTSECRKKMSESRKGEANPSWKGGITPENERIRASVEYKLWRTAVFERDKYTCVGCKTKKSPFEADHIKPFAYYPELRFAIDNGRTLCIACHRKTDTYGVKGYLKYKNERN